MEIKCASEEDLGFIYELWNEFCSDTSLVDVRATYSKEFVRGWKALFKKRIEAMSNEHGIVLVAAEKEEVVAFAAGARVLQVEEFGGKPVGVVEVVFVKKNSRNRGIGTALIKELIENLRVQFKVDLFEVHCLTNNVDGMRFWRKVGFTDYATRLLFRVK